MVAPSRATLLVTRHWFFTERLLTRDAVHVLCIVVCIQLQSGEFNKLQCSSGWLQYWPRSEDESNPRGVQGRAAFDQHDCQTVAAMRPKINDRNPNARRTTQLELLMHAFIVVVTTITASFLAICSLVMVVV